MTTAMKLREEGIEQGIEKGKLIDRRETLIRLLKKRFDDTVTSEDVILIEKCENPEKLKNAIEALISAKDCSEVLSFIR